MQVENVFRCGPLFSFPLHGIRATIRDIEYYEDSTPSAFRSCVSKMVSSNCTSSPSNCF